MVLLMICSMPLSWPYSPSMLIIQGVNHIMMCLISCIFRSKVVFFLTWTYHFLTLTVLALHPLSGISHVYSASSPSWVSFSKEFFQWIVEFLIFSFILAWVVFFSISTSLLNLLCILKYCFHFIQSFVFPWTSVRTLFPSCLSLFKSLFEHVCNCSFKFFFI